MNRINQKKGNSEKETSEKGQFWKRKIPKRTILNIGKGTSEKGQFCKGTI